MTTLIPDKSVFIIINYTYYVVMTKDKLFIHKKFLVPFLIPKVAGKLSFVMHTRVSYR